jgi:hypothetical protein
MEYAGSNIGLIYHSELRRAQIHSFHSAACRADDEVIFYYAGHGEAGKDRHYLLLANGRYPTEDLFRAEAETAQF